MLSGEEEGLLRFQELGDPCYDATCLGCGIVYEDRLGGMLLACIACAPLVSKFFPTIGDWTREAFATLCQALIDAAIWRCQRKTPGGRAASAGGERISGSAPSLPHQTCAMHVQQNSQHRTHKRISASSMSAGGIRSGVRFPPSPLSRTHPPLPTGGGCVLCLTPTG